MAPRPIVNPNAEDNVAGSVMELATRFVARVLLPEIQAFFESEEGQREFAGWKAQQEQNRLKRD